MSAADDPRHGTTAGVDVHRRDGTTICEPCRLARNAYQRGRLRDQILRRRRITSPLGFRRRVEALQAIGWSLNTIADRLGSTPQGVRHTAFAAKYVTAKRHNAMVVVYDELSMQLPDDPRANRRRMIAKKKGYAPPLAWDNIDDPDETPEGVLVDGNRLRPNDEMLTEFDWLVGLGESPEWAATKLGVSLGAIEKARWRRRDTAA